MLLLFILAAIGHREISNVFCIGHLKCIFLSVLLVHNCFPPQIFLAIYILYMVPFSRLNNFAVEFLLIWIWVSHAIIGLFLVIVKHKTDPFPLLTTTL